MDKEEILEKSRRQKEDEGTVYAAAVTASLPLMGFLYSACCLINLQIRTVLFLGACLPPIRRLKTMEDIGLQNRSYK